MLLCSVAQLCPTPCDPLDCSLPGLIHIYIYMCIYVYIYNLYTYMCVYVYIYIYVWKFSDKVIFKLKLKG